MFFFCSVENNAWRSASFIFADFCAVAFWSELHHKDTIVCIVASYSFVENYLMGVFTFFFAKKSETLGY